MKRNNLIDRLNYEMEERDYVRRSMSSWRGTFQGDHAERLAKVGKIILAVQVVFSIGLFVASFLPNISLKNVLAIMVLLPLPSYIFVLLFPQVTQWICRDKRDYADFTETEEWKKTHVNMGSSKYLAYFFLIIIFEASAVSIIAQVYKGFRILLVLCLAISFFLDLAGCLRIGFRRGRKTQIVLFILTTSVWACIATAAMCYWFSSPAVHEPCSYVSKKYSSGYRSATYYNVTVELSDGTTYQSRVSSSLYDEAENVELVACRRKGPFGIEYLRVHQASAGQQELSIKLPAATQEAFYAYAEYLEQYLKQHLKEADGQQAEAAHFGLGYVDEDDVPELFISDGSAHVYGVHILFCQGGQVVEAGEFGSFGAVKYTDHGNRIYDHYMGQGQSTNAVYCITDGKAVELQNFESYSDEYWIDGREVEEDVYLDNYAAWEIDDMALFRYEMGETVSEGEDFYRALVDLYCRDDLLNNIPSSQSENRNSILRTSYSSFAYSNRSPG